MKAYSLDLRTRIVNAALTGKSSRDVAKRFNVSHTTVQKLLRQYHHTQDLNPRPHPGRARKLDPEQLRTFQDLLDTHPELTLQERSDAFLEKTGVRLSSATTWRYTHRLGYSRKK